jgi:NTE family protein
MADAKPLAAQERKPKTALVFAGGGSFGAVQVGMLRALVAHGVKPDMVVGSSVGAMNGAYYAGAPNQEGVARLAAIWRSLRRRDVFPVTPQALLGFLRRRDFLLGSHGLYRLVHEHLPYRNLQDAKVPLHVVATDLLSGASVVLSEGEAATAIVASTAIPAAFAPVKCNGRYLADGAIASCTPVRVAVAQGATRLIVLPTGYACAREMPPQGAVANALHALTLLISRQVKAELESLDETIDFHVAPPLCPLMGSPYDFSQTSELIERSAQRTQEWLAEGGLERREIPHEMNAHKHV